MPLHPFIQRTIDRAERFGYQDLHLKKLPEIRRYYELSMQGKPKISHYQDIEIQPQVFIRLYSPPKQGTKPLPLLLYLRASGYIFGQVNFADHLCQHLAKRLGWMVAALEPRLAPEHKFPQPLADCKLMIEYLYHYHEQYGIDPHNIAIWGESSGGNLAASLCQQFGSAGDSIIKKQVLFYPLLDFHHHHPSRQEYAKGFLMDQRLGDVFMDNYLEHSLQKSDPRVSPLLAQDLQSLPPILIMGAQYDPVRDENVAYAQKCVADQVPTQMLIMPGLIHGYLMFAAKIKAAAYGLNYAVSFLKDKIPR